MTLAWNKVIFVYRIIAAIAIMVLGFIWDITSEIDLVVAIPYVLSVLIGLKPTHKWTLFLFLAVPSSLTILGPLIYSVPLTVEHFIHTRMIVLLLIWLSALMIFHHRESSLRFKEKNRIILHQSTKISKQQKELDIIFNSVPAMIWYKDKNNRILRANQHAAESMGLTISQCEGMSTYDLYPNDAKKYHEDDLEVINSGKPKYGIVERYLKANGDYRWVSTDKLPYRDESGEVVGVIVFAIDITEKKVSQDLQEENRRDLTRANVALKELVSKDYLTGVMNRRGLEDSLRAIVDDLRQNNHESYALLIDLDNFKQVNHVFGYVMGDLEIKKAGEAIQNTVRKGDYVGRVGGDEFMVLLPFSTEDVARSIAEKIRLVISQIVVGISVGESINLTTSIGMVKINERSSSLEELIERSYYSLNLAKDGGKNIVIYKDKIGVAQRDASGILSSMLREDSDQNHLCVFKQPIMNLRQNKIVGYELLTRLRNDKHYRMPNDFFRLAIETKVLTYIDRLCLQTCLKESVLLGSSQRIHVNIFPSTLIQVPTDDLIKEFEIQTVKGSEFCIEISEQQIIGDPSYIVESVKGLKGAGIRIALDDMGFGNSSLESLLSIEPDIIKIDIACVKDVAIDSDKLRSLKRLLKIIDGCGALAIAEGIESKEDRDVLMQLGIAVGQGFYFAEPMLLDVGQSTKIK